MEDLQTFYLEVYLHICVFIKILKFLFLTLQFEHEYLADFQ